MKKLLLLIFASIIVSTMIVSANEFNIPPYWLKMNDGTRLDADNDGLIDLSENSNLLQGHNTLYFFSLTQFQNENNTLWSAINNRLLTTTFTSENASLWLAIRNISSNVTSNYVLTNTFTSENLSVWTALNNISANLTGAYLLATDQRYNETTTLNAQITRQSADNTTLASRIGFLEIKQSSDNITLASQIQLRATISSLTANMSLTLNVAVLNSNISKVYTDLQANATALNSRIDAVNLTASGATNYSQYTNVSHLAINTTTLQIQNGLLNVIFSWFTNLFYQKSEIDSKETILNNTINTKLNITDQRYNETTALNNQNVSNNAYIATKLDATDQRYNETAMITAVNGTANSKLVDVVSANSYIATSGTTNKTITFSETVLNTTIATALATTYYNITNITIITGTGVGTLANINSYDGVSYNISEASSDMDVNLTVSNVTSFNQLVIRYKTIVGENHELAVYLWDYGSGSWESYDVLTNTNNIYVIRAINVFDSAEHISSNIVKIRLVTTNVGASTDMWSFDWVSASKGVASQVGIELDPLSIHKNGDVPLTANWAANYNITGTQLLAAIDQRYNETAMITAGINAVNLSAVHNGEDATITLNQTNIRNFNANCSDGNVLYGFDNSYNYCTDVTVYNDTDAINTKLTATDQRYNDTALANAKALPGTCTGTNVVQNTTTAGVQCIAVSTSAINGTNANLTSLLVGSGYQLDKGSCPNRPLVSVANVTMSVPSQYSTIQLAVCQIPFFLRHIYTINVDPATYTLRENVTISNVYGTRDRDYNGGQLRINGGSSGNYAKVGSFMISGFTGQGNPKIQYFNATSFNPDYAVTTTCQYCFLGVQQFDMYDDVTSGTPTGGESHGILAYGGTTGKLSKIFLGNSTYFGLTVKQGSSVWIRDEGIKGDATNFAFNTGIGNIYYYNRNDVSWQLRGNGIEGNYVTDQGLLYASDNALGQNQSIFGIDRVPDLDELTFHENAVEYRDAGSRGFRLWYDETANELNWQSKSGDTTYQKFMNVGRDSGTVRFLNTTTSPVLNVTGVIDFTGTAKLNNANICTATNGLCSGTGYAAYRQNNTWQNGAHYQGNMGNASQTSNLLQVYPVLHQSTTQISAIGYYQATNNIGACILGIYNSTIDNLPDKLIVNTSYILASQTAFFRNQTITATIPSGLMWYASICNYTGNRWRLSLNMILPIMGADIISGNGGLSYSNYQNTSVINQVLPTTFPITTATKVTDGNPTAVFVLVNI